MKALRLLAAILVLLLAACASVTDHRAPAGRAIANPSASGRFQGASQPEFTDAPVPGQWWRLYESPELNQLITDALASNTDLRVATANLARAQAGLEYADANSGLSTSLQAGTAFSRPSAEEVLHPGKPLPNHTGYSLGASVSYQLDLFGQVARTIEAAQADLGAAQAARDAVRVTVVAETTRAYLDACSAGREVQVAQRQVDTQSKSRELTQRLLRTGRGTSVDVERSVSQEDQVRASVPVLQAQKKVALLKLALLTGRTPAELPASITACDHEPQLAKAIPVGDGAALLKRRPDIRKAESDLRGAAARIGVVTGDLYPKISLGGSIGSVGRIGNFGDSDTFKFSLGPLISWQFPDRSRVHAQIHGAEADEQAALARFDGSVLTALKETESALEVYARDLDRREHLARSRDAAQRAARDTEQLYASGRSGFLPVLDATRSLVAAEQSLASADSKVASDQVNVFLALGGGWESSE
jgi:NodT family efflux transporter outer membrane factor (OMF) lipoprotein